MKLFCTLKFNFTMEMYVKSALNYFAVKIE